MTRKRQAGIYRFTNNINGKVYIGSSLDLKQRKAVHKRMGNKSAEVLRSAIKKYGYNNFSYDVLEYVHNYNNLESKEFLKFLREREQVYLDIYFAKDYIEKKNNFFKKLTYNVNPKAYGGFGNKQAVEKLKKYAESTRISVYKIDSKLNFEKFKSFSEASKSTGCTVSAISLCCREIQNISKGYSFCYENDLERILNKIKNTSNFFKIEKIVKQKETKKYKLKITNIETSEVIMCYSFRDAGKKLNYSRYILADIFYGKCKKPIYKIEKLCTLYRTN